MMVKLFVFEDLSRGTKANACFKSAFYGLTVVVAVRSKGCEFPSSTAMLTTPKLQYLIFANLNNRIALGRCERCRSFNRHALDSSFVQFVVLGGSEFQLKLFQAWSDRTNNTPVPTMAAHAATM
jgi:hypothetical protein